jgi:hypothetical protein
MLIVLSRAAVIRFHVSRTTDGWLIGQNIFPSTLFIFTYFRYAYKSIFPHQRISLNATVLTLLIRCGYGRLYIKGKYFTNSPNFEGC